MALASPKYQRLSPVGGEVGHGRREARRRQRSTARRSDSQRFTSCRRVVVSSWRDLSAVALAEAEAPARRRRRDHEGRMTANAVGPCWVGALYDEGSLEAAR